MTNGDGREADAGFSPDPAEETGKSRKRETSKDSSRRDHRSSRKHGGSRGRAGAGAAHVIEAGAALVIETTVDTTSLQSGIDDHVAGTRNLLETKVSIEILQPKRVIAEIVMQMVTMDHQVMYKKDLLEATGTLLVDKAGMIITTVLQLTVDVIKETGTIVLCHLPKTCEGLLVERIGMVHFVKHQFAKIAVDLLLPKICEGLRSSTLSR